MTHAESILVFLFWSIGLAGFGIGLPLACLAILRSLTREAKIERLRLFGP